MKMVLTDWGMSKCVFVDAVLIASAAVATTLRKSSSAFRAAMSSWDPWTADWLKICDWSLSSSFRISLEMSRNDREFWSVDFPRSWLATQQQLDKDLGQGSKATAERESRRGHPLDHGGQDDRESSLKCCQLCPAVPQFALLQLLPHDLIDGIELAAQRGGR